MATPWIPAPQPPPAERPWMGMALLIAVPLLSLVLIRMLWSGSSVWFLLLGILLLGAAAVVFLARRRNGLEYDRSLAMHETHRAPLFLTAAGVLFLAMLLLPNFSGGDDSQGDLVGQQQAAGDLTSDVADSSVGTLQDAQEAAPQEEGQPPSQAPASGETYVVESGDTLWGIAQQFDTTVEAIAAANQLPDSAELQVGQELVIPAPAEAVAP